MITTKLTGCIGARVDDLRLGGDLNPGTIDQLHDLLAEHGVLFFPGQSLSEDEQVALTDLLGGAVSYPLSKLMTGAEKLVGTIRDHAKSPPDADNWHTDITWTQDPPAYAVLQALQLPPYGGDTLWCSLEAAYEALSDPMKRMCEGLTAFHTPGPRFVAANRRIFGDEKAAQIEQLFPGVHHPLVRSHPRTGRLSLFYSSFIDRIDGVTDEESELLIAYIRRILHEPNLQVRWHWSVGDVAIWDEANTNHRALSDHFAKEPQERCMQRSVVRGTIPYFREPLSSGGPREERKLVSNA